MASSMKHTGEILRNAGLKTTSQRIAVYDAMCLLGHASADDVYRKIKADGSSFTLATVYNVLDSFAVNGLVSRRFSSNNKMYFDITTTPHCHLYDDRTDTIVDYNDPELSRMVNDYIAGKRLEGYEIKGVDIQIIGHKTNK